MTDTQTLSSEQTEQGSGEQTQTDAGAAGEAAKKVKSPRALVLVSISVPQAMKDILDRLAEEQKTTTASVARAKLAQVLDFTLPPMKRERGKKFATEAERKAFTAAKQKDRNAKASALLAALEAGELEIDLAEVLAKFAPKPRAKKTGTDGAAEAATTDAEATTQASA